MTDLDLLIAGAGPTGLTLAVEAARHGLAFRIVDRAAGPSEHSKALAVQARTLEVFDDLGIVDEALARGSPFRRVNVHADGRRLGTLRFDGLESPYPFPLILSQAETERLLATRLEALGGAVERATELVAFRREGDGVAATLRGPAGTDEEVRARWLAGCDGAHSSVRHGLDLPFEGAAYPEDFVLADVRVEWDLAPDEAHGFFAGADLLAALPMPGESRFRLIATRPPGTETGEEPDLEEFDELLRVVAGVEARVSDPTWLARFRLHRRLAPRFREGPVFLLGDAAHIHSPAGGQGMNTGIQDATNLGWKMGLVAEGVAGDGLLATYDAERRPVAETIVRWTDFFFRVALGQNPVVRFVRRLAPRAALTSERLTAMARRRVSQIGIGYPGSPIVAEGEDARFDGGARPGFRAPDGRVRMAPDGREARLFDLFRGPHHTLVAFGMVDPADLASLEAVLGRALAGRLRVAAIEGDADGTTFAAYGVVEGGLVLVRPDGMIAWRGPRDATSLVRFVDAYR